MNKPHIEVTQGEDLNIYCFVRDINGNLAVSSDLKVSIYPYGKEPGDVLVTEDDAVVLEASPTNPKYGQYLYTYETANDAQVGTWYSFWEGTVGGKTFKTIISFQVLSNGNDAYASTQDDGTPVLFQNNLYTVQIEGIESTDGVTLTESSWFTSEYSPMYSTSDRVFSKIGNVLSGIDIDTCNFLIWLNSLEADSKVMSRVVNEPWLLYAKEEYVWQKTAITLIDNINFAAGTNKSKQLGDFRVEWKDNTDGLKAIVRKLNSNIEKLERILNSGGQQNYETSLLPQSSILGYNLPEYPPLGRSLDFTSPCAPYLNSKSRKLGTYRTYYDFNPR